MDPAIAVRLIQDGVPHGSTAQRWVDLGAGNGLFTTSLAGLLPYGSTVWAIDKAAASLDSIPGQVGSTTIKKTKGDFTVVSTIPDHLHGVLMANALHFVRDQELFISHLQSRLRPRGRIILVEYDTDENNPWVPYPIAFSTIRSRYRRRFTTIEKMTETPSAFGRAAIYSALLIR